MSMSSLQDILITLIAIEFFVIAACIVIVTYFLIKAIRTVTDTAESIKEKLQMRAASFMPALLIALIGRILKRARG